MKDGWTLCCIFVIFSAAWRSPLGHVTATSHIQLAKSEKSDVALRPFVSGKYTGRTLIDTVQNISSSDTVVTKIVLFSWSSDLDRNSEFLRHGYKDANTTAFTQQHLHNTARGINDDCFLFRLGKLKNCSWYVSGYCFHDMEIQFCAHG